MKKKRAVHIIIFILLAIAALCGYFFARELRTAREEIAVYTDVQQKYTSITYEHGNVAVSPETAKLPYVEVDFDALLLKNPDTVGWIAIPGSVISYPVVQAHDNAKYLNTSFDDKRSGVGTPFADKDNNMRDLDSNTIIYGHNMGAGRADMFGTLLSYKDYDYYLAHRYIQFDTIYMRHGWWKVFAVIGHDIRAEDFQYRQLQFQNENDFMDWITKAKELSIHGADMDIAPHDRILTLSTCDRSKYGRSGRILILAVQTSGQFGPR